MAARNGGCSHEWLPHGLAIGQRGATGRALVRKEKLAKAPADGVEIVTGDLLDPVSVRQALEGVDKLYLLNAALPDELTQGLM